MLAENIREKRLLAIALLEAFMAYPARQIGNWQYQGLGMFRFYLAKDLRLHLWDPSQAVPEVSTIHTHPWNLHSEVLLGTICNQRYAVTETLSGRAISLTDGGKEVGNTRSFWRQKLQCGVGGCLKDDPRLVVLERLPLETYSCEGVHVGNNYSQRAYEIHETIVRTPAAITLVSRKFCLADEDHAYVYWEKGAWVSAEPRPATILEMTQAVKKALNPL